MQSSKHWQCTGQACSRLVSGFRTRGSSFILSLDQYPMILERPTLDFFRPWTFHSSSRGPRSNARLRATRGEGVRGDVLRGDIVRGDVLRRGEEPRVRTSGGRGSASLMPKLVASLNACSYTLPLRTPAAAAALIALTRDALEAGEALVAALAT